jgi:hypothetical protein
MPPSPRLLTIWMSFHSEVDDRLLSKRQLRACSDFENTIESPSRSWKGCVFRLLISQSSIIPETWFAIWSRHFSVFSSVSIEIVLGQTCAATNPLSGRPTLFHFSESQLLFRKRVFVIRCVSPYCVRLTSSSGGYMLNALLLSNGFSRSVRSPAQLLIISLNVFCSPKWCDKCVHVCKHNQSLESPIGSKRVQLDFSKIPKEAPQPTRLSSSSISLCSVISLNLFNLFTSDEIASTIQWGEIRWESSINSVSSLQIEIAHSVHLRWFGTIAANLQNADRQIEPRIEEMTEPFARRSMSHQIVQSHSCSLCWRNRHPPLWLFVDFR